MTKKDFQLIAAVICDLPEMTSDTVTRRNRADIAEQFADALAPTNPLFKRELFIQAATGVVSSTARKPREVAP